jgi:hypothetical protein
MLERDLHPHLHVSLWTDAENGDAGALLCELRDAVARECTVDDLTLSGNVSL